nr:immunoglobulin light chain junction region [Macaca mulatta]
EYYCWLYYSDTVSF